MVSARLFGRAPFEPLLKCSRQAHRVDITDAVAALAPTGVKRQDFGRLKQAPRVLQLNVMGPPFEVLLNRGTQPRSETVAGPSGPQQQLADSSVRSRPIGCAS